MRRIVPLVLLLSLVVLGCAKKQRPVMAPYFEVKGVDGKTYTLSQYKGKPLLLVFWATWCPTCKKELAKVAQDYQKLKDAGLEVLLVSMDKNVDAVVRTAREHHFGGLPIAIVSNQMVMDYQGVRFLPTGFLISPRGYIVRRFVGELPVDEILKELRAPQAGRS